MFYVSLNYEERLPCARNTVKETVFNGAKLEMKSFPNQLISTNS